MKRTKIICTIGPASEDQKILADMVENGMNVARLNFSHGTYENHSQLIKNIRAVSAKLKAPIAIMQDLQGPKIRVSQLPESVKVRKGESLVIGEDFNLDFDITNSVKPDERVLIEDGLIELRITKVQPSPKDKPHTGKIHCNVVAPGLIQSHKGVNLPNSQITFPILTNKDIQDLKFGLKNDVDYVALSFVRNSDDIVNIKNLIKKYAPRGSELPKIIAKIERGEAVENFDHILHETDAIMIARGDLGVEIADTQVPLIQKTLISKCIKAAKPVIVATQMLDSMIRNPRPTRAEVSDVANAVLDHADAVMLSGESAFGNYPLQAVSEMNRIIEATEQSPFNADRSHYISLEKGSSRASAIAGSVRNLADSIGANAIIGTTETGFTARFLAHQRSEQQIIILTDHPKVYRQLCLFWGVHPLYVRSLSALKDVDGLLKHFISETKKLKLVSKGDKVVLVAGNPLGQRMNLVQAVTVS